VGKGITFDSGGLSIKPAEAMETMKTDCSGAAAVVAALTALPALGARIKVTAVTPLAENMPGGAASSRATSSATMAGGPPRSSTRTPRVASSSPTPWPGCRSNVPRR